jgi:hypothetical protein
MEEIFKKCNQTMIKSSNIFDLLECPLDFLGYLKSIVKGLGTFLLSTTEAVTLQLKFLH